MNEENSIDAYQPTFQTGALRDPVWYEGQTVFEMGNGKISWKNNIYQSCRRHFIQEADVIEENRERSIVKVNLAREAFLCKAKIVCGTIVIYTPILIGTLALLK